MQEKLDKLGLRIEGDFTLHSGAKTNVKWDIEKLFDVSIPDYERLFYLRPWHREILKFIRSRDILIVGIPTGGYFLAQDFATHYKFRYAHPKYHLENTKKWNALIVDDVLTTGTTVREYFDKVHVLAVAVLVNRSKLTRINNRPIISGFFADEVNTVS